MQDNTAVIAICNQGYSPKLCHVSKHHRISLGSLYEVFPVELQSWCTSRLRRSELILSPNLCGWQMATCTAPTRHQTQASISGDTYPRDLSETCEGVEEWMRVKSIPNVTSLMHLVVAHGSPGVGSVVSITNIQSLTGIPKCMSLPKRFKPGIQFAGHLTT